MQKFQEFFKVFGFSITGLVFGFSFFLLFINFYHYREVNYSYEKQDSDLLVYDSMKEKLEQTKTIAASFDSHNYQGKEDLVSMTKIQSKLTTCVTKIDTETFDSFFTKESISIQDVYEIQQFYQSVVADECLVKQLYDLSNNSEETSLKVSNLSEIAPFFDNQINSLIKSTDYVQKLVKGNSSYYFSSDNSKVTLYDQTRDSYYSLLNSYQDAIDFIYDVSIWYQGLMEG